MSIGTGIAIAGIWIGIGIGSLVLAKSSFSAGALLSIVVLTTIALVATAAVTAIKLDRANDENEKI